MHIAYIVNKSYYKHSIIIAHLNKHLSKLTLIKNVDDINIPDSMICKKKNADLGSDQD